MSTEARTPGPLASSESQEKAIREGLLLCYEARVRKRFGKMQYTSELHQNLQRVSVFLHRWFGQRNHRHKGLMLIGGNGNGKTTMLGAIGDYIGEVLDTARPYVSNTGIRPRFWKSKDIAREAATDRPSTAYDEIKRCNVLMVDDFGAEPTEVVSYGMPLHPMEDVLDYRYDNLLPTFLSSNLSLRQLFGYTDAKTGEHVDGKYPDPRIMDRAREMFEILTFEGGSYR